MTKTSHIKHADIHDVFSSAEAQTEENAGFSHSVCEHVPVSPGLQFAYPLQDRRGRAPLREAPITPYCQYSFLGITLLFKLNRNTHLWIKWNCLASEQHLCVFYGLVGVNRHCTGKRHHALPTRSPPWLAAWALAGTARTHLAASPRAESGWAGWSRDQHTSRDQRVSGKWQMNEFWAREHPWRIHPKSIRLPYAKRGWRSDPVDVMFDEWTPHYVETITSRTHGWEDNFELCLSFYKLGTARAYLPTYYLCTLLSYVYFW